jgi:hypothetical protein
VVRLRAENRALLNSILGIAGVPPIVVAADDPAAAVAPELVGHLASSGGSSRIEAERGAGKPVALQNASSAGQSEIRKTSRAKPGMKSVATPLRRRSWHQVYRMLEIDAARKKEVI